MYDVGDVYPATVDVVDEAGQAVNPVTVSFTFTMPDGTTTTVTPNNPSAGRFTYDLPLTQSGLHRWRATSTSPATSYSDVFNVADASSPAFVGLAEVKEHLNIPSTVTTHDDELRAFIASACGVVESIIGPVARRTVVETHSGTGGALVLTQRPVLSVTSVVEDGATVAASDYSWTPTGVLTRDPDVMWSGWSYGVDNITVTYEVGRQVVSPATLDGTKELIRLNWRPQVGGAGSVFDTGRGDTSGQTGQGEVRLGFFVPNTVMQRLEPSARPPLVA